MELILTRQAGTQVVVTCDSEPSHTIDVLTLVPGEQGPPQPIDDPVAYGKAVYQALFPPESATRRKLEVMPERILLVTTDNDLDAVPWEYAYGPNGLLVLECHFVRGLPADQRIAPPTLDTGLHIVAIPSNPLNHDVEPLNIEGEWMRLKDIIQRVPYALTLERTRPPTIEQVRTLVVNQRHRVIHFMGHGGQSEQGAVLYFEQDNGELDPVTTRQFVLRVRGTVFLVTLNACISATPGATTFSNLAASLARQRTPYALGMRFSIPDDDARSFSRTFYSDLARGSSVEEALLQARLTLANSSRSWVVGVPVLYTSLAQPATGFASLAGSPIIREHQPRIEVSALPRAEGAFQGRVNELKVLGTALTGDSRPPLVTIHGAGGQGKTALVREAVERFGYAWPGGVWATSLENLPSRELFASDLARFLSIDTQTAADPAEVERLVMAHLVHRRMLIVLDNVETLVEAIEANNEEAIRLAQFLREQLPRPPVSLLATSRSFLGWTSEVGYELAGLAPIDSVRLFQQHAPQRGKEINQTVVWELSEKVEGHPLSLRLLGSAFNASAISFSAFAEEYEASLLKTEDKYKVADHRHRTLYASLETSVRYLDSDLRSLLSGLWIFHASFVSQTAAAIFDPMTEDTPSNSSPVHDHLDALWQRGLLVRESVDVHGEMLQFYRLLPTVRFYVKYHLEQIYEHKALQERFGVAYAQIAGVLYEELNRNVAAAIMVRRSREDFEQAATYLTHMQEGYYLLHWTWILSRLENPRLGLKSLERVLEIAEGQDRNLELQAFNNMAGVYRATGQPQLALALYEQALLIHRELNNREGEATALNNMAEVYQVTGQPKLALTLYEQALFICRELNNREGEATALNNMAGIYTDTGRPELALTLYEQALPLIHEVGNRASEAKLLNNIAQLCQATGQPQQALTVYEQALFICREMGDRVSEAVALNNMAVLYRVTGQPQLALTLYEQALSIRCEVADRAGEATTLNNIAEVYHALGQPEASLRFCQQALPIMREVDNRAGEATTLNNMARTYHALRQPEASLRLYQQALPIMREVGNRAGEATTLNNMARTYRTLGQPELALTLYQQALPIRREVGDRAGEATTINNMARVYHALKQPEVALTLYQQALPIMREVDDRASEANTLTNIGLLLYRHFNRPKEAITHLERAIAVLLETGLSRDAAGRSVDELQWAVQAMQAGLPL
jgi:tetratricopeptide (TPR) repeat protein